MTDVNRNDAGFSLVEMLAVTLILALASVAALQFNPLTKRPNISSEVSKVHQFFNLAKLQARESGKLVAVSIDIDDKKISTAGNGEIKIASEFSLSVLTGRELAPSDSFAKILFFPKGGSTGGEVELTSESGRKRGIRINWLTGALTTTEGSSDAQ